MTILFSRKNTPLIDSEFCFKDEKNPDFIECVDFLNKLQEKYAYCSQWTTFYFSHFQTSDNVVIYERKWTGRANV